MFEVGCAYTDELRRAIVVTVESAAPFTKYTKHANENSRAERADETAARPQAGALAFRRLTDPEEDPVVADR